MDVYRSSRGPRTLYIPIRVCSYRKTGVKNGYLKDHYNCKMLVAFFRKFDKHAILSRKYGICISSVKYDSYGDDEMLPDDQLLLLLSKQSKEYEGITFLYWNHRPTHEKWIKMMKDAGFNVKDFKTLKEIDSMLNPKLTDFA